MDLLANRTTPVTTGPNTQVLITPDLDSIGKITNPVTPARPSTTCHHPSHGTTIST